MSDAFIERVTSTTREIGNRVASPGTVPPPLPPTQKPDAILRPEKKAKAKAISPELQQMLAGLPEEQRALAETALTGAGASSDRLALLGISDAFANSPVMTRRGDASSLGTSPTIGMSNYRPPETSTVIDTLEEFWDLDKAQLIDLQQRLWAGGFFGEGDPPAFGGDLTKTYEAYRDAVLLAAQSGKGLMDEILNPEAEGPPTSELTNREDIRVLLERVAPEAIGRRLTEEETERAVAAWHAREQEIPSDGEEPLSAEANLDLTLAEVAPGEEETMDFARNSLAFFSMLDSPVS